MTIPPPSPASRRSGWWRGLVRVTVALVLAAGCAEAITADRTVRSATGRVIESGELGVVHLRPGDCLRDPVPNTVEMVVAVPCARPHAAQVLAVADTTVECFEALDRVLRDLDGRRDLPAVDMSALITDDEGRVVCILEFAAPVGDDLVRSSS